MATLTPTLTLTSSDTTGDSLALSATDALTVANPAVNVARTSIATGSAQTLIPTNSAFSYIYIKVESSANAAAWVQLKLGGSAVSKLLIGEFMFLPIYSSLAVEAEAQTAACVVEYGYWSV